MRLICEQLEDVEFICEDSKKGKNYFIEGVFMQANVKNRNGRVYPKAILQKEAKRYEQNYILQKRAFGELGHPEGPTVNLERVSHMITELNEDGNDFRGRAKIMDTPYGKIVKNLIDEGARLGVSSRGMGSLKPVGRNCSHVQDDFYLATAADIVADPSAPAAFVNGIMEGKEWIWDNGILDERHVARIEKEMKITSQKQLDEVQIKAFNQFMSSL
ncbi:uncharacterized protein METZ01_LOCUS170574 [marine metagenome]|uniref:Primosomal protein n=1 Tax=marine metagenome TaxID=408172 RepID=A0A382BV60_9ZZZZ